MTSRSLRRAACAALALPLALAGAAAAAPMQIIDPVYDWHFEAILSNGVGGTLADPVDAEPPDQQIGGALQEDAFLNPSRRPTMEVFSNTDGTTFWASARSPGGSPDLIGTPLGARTTFTLTQTFQVVDENATLSFTISQVDLAAFDPPGGPGNEGLSAYLSFDVVALDANDDPFFFFLDETELTGEGLDWNVDDLSGPLVTQIVQGAETQPSIRVALTGPHTETIDLSAFDARDLFTLRYTIVAEAIDTEQFDSRISAFARDPLDPGVGSFFEYAGIVPISSTVPEPGTALLLFAGLAGLAGIGRARRPA
jgi:hypothetical protein